MSKNIIKAHVKIKGTRPLLWHHFGPDAIPLEKAEKTGVAGHDPEEWKRSVLHDEDGRLYVEPTYVFGTVVNGARYTKKGRGSIQSSVAATLMVDDARVYTDRKMPEGIYNGKAENYYNADSEPIYIDIRSVRNPSTKGRNVRYRVAASPGWEMGFTLLFDKTIVSRNEIEAVIKDAGALVGIGSGRAIGFGRFKVTEFSVTE